MSHVTSPIHVKMVVFAVVQATDLSAFAKDSTGEGIVKLTILVHLILVDTTELATCLEMTPGVFVLMTGVESTAKWRKK